MILACPWPFLLPACNVDMMLEMQQPYYDYEVKTASMKADNRTTTEWADLLIPMTIVPTLGCYLWTSRYVRKNNDN